MTQASGIDDLYSARILALAANMPHAGRLPSSVVEGSSERTAKLCGSRVTVDVALDDEGRVERFAQDVQACALGQASAGILGSQVIGASAAEVDHARDALKAMLKDGGPAPAGRFSDLAILGQVRDYPARHASTMLAFEAAAEAISRARVRTPTAVAG
ncbi:iron-sulfur cluster assembly scaffold protein [soil metagenome]